MPPRPASRVLAAALLAALAAACAPESALVSASTAAQLAKGGGSGGGGSTPPAPVASVAGTWTGTVRRSSSPGDTTRWSLSLTQNGERVEGGLIRIAYYAGGSSASASRIKTGSVVGQQLSVTFIGGGEGAETKPGFSATVGADGRSMTGSYTYYPELITLTR